MTQAEKDAAIATIQALIQEQLVSMLKFVSENTRHGINMASGCRETVVELRLQLEAAKLLEVKP